MTAAELRLFEEGDIKSINKVRKKTCSMLSKQNSLKALPVDEQTDLLPYNK